MTDEPDTAELENRIEKLEATIEKMMPSRRDALKMGGAALVGGATMSGTASAGTNQVGTIGSQASPVDLESEDINNADTVTTQDLVVNGTATGPFGGGVPPNFSYSQETNNRSFDTEFTNNTGKALYVVVEGFMDSGNDLRMIFRVNGVDIAISLHEGNPGFTQTSVQAFVPDGATYKVVSPDGNLSGWVEAEM